MKIENKSGVLLGAYCYHYSEAVHHGYYIQFQQAPERNCTFALFFFLQMGQINPTAALYVVTVDGSSSTTELRPPDSFEKRFELHTL